MPTRVNDGNMPKGKHSSSTRHGRGRSSGKRSGGATHTRRGLASDRCDPLSADVVCDVARELTTAPTDENDEDEEDESSAGPSGSPILLSHLIFLLMTLPS